MGKSSIKLIANNKKAYHDFFIDDTFETGVSLHGTEVKSLRMGKCSIKEAFVQMCIRDRYPGRPACRKKCGDSQ